MEYGANIIIIPDSKGTPRKLIPEYGRLTMKNIEANIQNFIGQQSRQSKNSVQLFHCITNSMTEAAHLKILEESNKYMEDETPVGELLLKLMMQKTFINTGATYTHRIENLTNLDTYISKVNSDIDNFNQYVKVTVGGLKARGQCTYDLMINLLKAYQVASDGKFVRYINTKRDQYDNRYNISTDELMNSALIFLDTTQGK